MIAVLLLIYMDLEADYIKTWGYIYQWRVGKKATSIISVTLWLPSSLPCEPLITLGLIILHIDHELEAK